MKSDLTKLQRVLGYTFQDPKLLTEALMHRSFASENNLRYDNQRLEFLGDSVLQIVLTEFIFQRYTDYAEGPMTKIRSAMSDQTALAILARKINLGEYLLLGRGEIENDGGNRDSTLSDALESVFAAIYLDGGLEPARTVILHLMEEAFPRPEDLLLTNNPKGALQEFSQKYYGVSPIYQTLSVEGEDHDPLFTVQVSLQDVVLATATARKRKTAEGIAAGHAITLLKEGKIPGLQEKKEG